MLERPFWYSKQTSLAANETRLNERISLRGQADFIARAAACYTSSNAIEGRFRRMDGSWWTGNQFAHLDLFFRDANDARWTPLQPQIAYPASSSIEYDLRDVGGAGDSEIHCCFIGVERYPDGVLPPVEIPARYVERPYTVEVRQTIAAGDNIPRIPVRCNTGDAFAIRGLTWSYTGTEPTLPQFRLYDHHQRGFSSDWIPLRLVFAPTTAALRAPVFPELVIPANGTFYIDLNNRDGGSRSFELQFHGVRLEAV